MKVFETGHSIKINEGNQASGLNLIWIEPGDFLQGSPPSEIGRLSDEQYIHVNLTKGFWIGKFPITDSQWKFYLEDISDSVPDCLPKTNVNWYDAINFCNRLNGLYKDYLPNGYKFSLPTESQWEYSARAGTRTANYLSNDLADVEKIGWVSSNSHDRLQPVGQLLENAWGLADVIGNVWEWCYDFYGGGDHDATVFDRCICVGYVQDDFPLRTMRGGACYNTLLNDRECRIAARSYIGPDALLGGGGFRIAIRDVQQEEELKKACITKARWGAIQFGSEREVFKDVICYPEGHVRWDWAKTNTHHVPGIQIADIEQLLEKSNVELILLSSGFEDKLQIMDETLNYLKKKNIKYIFQDTSRIISEFNWELMKGTKVGALIHSTC